MLFSSGDSIAYSRKKLSQHGFKLKRSGYLSEISLFPSFMFVCL